MSKVYAAGSTEELLTQLRYASIGEGDILKQYGVTSIAPQMTVCGKAADTIEECMRMLLDRDKRIAELQAELAALRRMVEHVAYYSLDNMPPDVRAAAQALLQERGE